MSWYRNKSLRFGLLFITAVLCCLNICAAEDTGAGMVGYKTADDIFYLDMPEGKADALATQFCRLDVLYPENKKDLPVVIWLHGGGLQAGKKYFPEGFKKKDFVVVAVDYRLSPAVNCPVYIEDAAAAVAWTFRNVQKYGGDPDKIFISGFSAGGFLAAMLGLDPQWLGKYGIKTTQLAGIISISGMMTTHFAIRAERGDKSKVPVLDAFAPISHASADAPPLLLVNGDRELDWPGRVEENFLLARTMKIVGHKDTAIYELQGHKHGDGLETAAAPIILRWINQRSGDPM
jgi:acetyl esterase/lipase